MKLTAALLGLAVLCRGERRIQQRTPQFQGLRYLPR
jgi:hypothetical protein